MLPHPPSLLKIAAQDTMLDEIDLRLLEFDSGTVQTPLSNGFLHTGNHKPSSAIPSIGTPTLSIHTRVI